MKIFLQHHFLIVFMICFAIKLNSQNSGNQVFDANIMHEVRLTFDQEDYWEQLTNNYENNPDGIIPYVMATVVIDEEVVDSIGVKFKGFTSYIPQIDKKPMKLDFNTFVKGQRLDGLRKVNLNVGFADPGMQRDFLAYYLLRRFGVKAPRVSFCNLYINEQFWGVYQLIEQIDREFLQNNFTESDGNLFKNDGQSFLEYEGPNPSQYQPPFELKTNEDANDWSGFVDFIDFINNASDEDFISQIDDYLDVESYLKTLVLDVAINNWDSHVLFGRNFYLYEPEASAPFHWLPWDYNLSFGAGGFGVLGGDCEIASDFVGVTNGSNAVSFVNISEVNTDVNYKWNFGDGNTSIEADPSHTYDEIGTYEVCLEVNAYVGCGDTLCRTIDLSFDPTSCGSISNGSFTDEVDFKFQRILYSRPSCCQLWDGICEERYDELADRLDGINFITLDIDQRKNAAVLIQRLLSNDHLFDQYLNEFCGFLTYVFEEENLRNFMLTNRNLIEASVLLDTNFLYTYGQYELAFEDREVPGSLQHFISSRKAQLQEELSSLTNCNILESYPEFRTISINELLAENDESNVADQDGEFDDWIELYNNSENTISISDLYMTDNEEKLYKWQFPSDLELEGHSYLSIWADDDLDQMGLHSNFKLSREGESLFLVHKSGKILDSLTFGAQEQNTAYARVPNGIGNFRMQTPTFEANNEIASSTKNEFVFNTISITPNPSVSRLTVEYDRDLTGNNITVEIYNTQGVLVHSTSSIPRHRKMMIEHDLPTGIYFLQLRDQVQYIGRERMVVMH